MNAIVEQINSGGYAFVEFAASMLIQASVLIVLLFLADLALRKKVRAVFRYWIWLLVLVKLVLPTSLSGPFSIGYWFGDKLEYADAGRAAYEPQAAGPTMPALPYIDISNVPPAIHPPATSPAPDEVDVGAAQPIAPLSVPPVQIEWQGVVFLLWLAIVTALVLLLVQRAIFVHGLVAQAREASRPMYDALEECRSNMKVRVKVGLKVSPNAASPAVCGLLRPVILVPQNLASALDTADLRIVLLHELAHVKRGDLWVNLAQTVLQIVYFYNPLLWLANAVIRRAREQAVDEAVLVAMGEKARRYPQTLVSVAKLAFNRPALSLRLIGVVESKSALTARIKRILSRPIPKSAKLGILGLAVIVITAAIVLPMAKAQPYTDRARRVMALAEQEARRLKHEYVGTEHILLALAGQKDGVAAKVLDKLGIDKGALEGELKKLVKTGSEAVTKSRLPQTPRAKKALELAEQEAKALDHDYIGTEHILLGLLQEKDGVAAQMLANLGVSLDVARAEALDLVKPGPNADGMAPSMISGQVLDDVGEPVTGAQVGLSTADIGVGMSNGKLEPIDKESEGRITVTDSQGAFNLGECPDGDFDLIVACDDGFAFVESKEFGAPREIRIRPWGRIEGQLASGRKATENKIWMASLPNWTMLPHRWQLMDEGMCDGDDRFVFDKVPAGWFEVGFLVPTGRSGSSITCRTPVVVEAGQTSKMTLGGTGRPVVGKFIPPAGYDEPIPFDEGLRSLVTARPKQPRPDNYEQMKKEQQHRWYLEWRKTDEYQDYLNAGWRNNNWRQYTFRINKDGSFRIEDVIAGKYEMDVSIERLPGGGPGEEIGGYYGAVEMPPIPGGRSDEPLDLGTLKLHIAGKEPPAEPASPQPEYSAKLANGMTVELIGLFCGVEEDKRVWWRADGTELPKDSFQRYDERIKPMVWNDIPERRLLYGYVFTSLPSEDVELISDVSEGTRWHTGFADAQRSAYVVYVYSHTIEEQETPPDVGGIKIAAAAGEGEQFESKVYSGNVEDTHILENGTNVIVSGPREYQGFDEKMVDVIVTASDIHVAVSYELKSGVVKSAKRDSVMGGPSIVSFYGTQRPLHQHSFRVFDPWDQITKFIVDCRKYELVTFKNVSLRPGYKSDVGVEVETLDEKAGLVWGEEVNGLRAAIEFEPEKHVYSIPEKIGVRFHIQNVSNKQIQFISTTWRQEQRVIVEDQDGKVQNVGSAWYSGETPIERYHLQPGQQVVIDSSALGVAADSKQAEQLGHPVGHRLVCKPGTYFVRFPLIIPDVKTTSLPEQPEDWKGELETGRHKLVVTAGPGAEMLSLAIGPRVDSGTGGAAADSYPTLEQIRQNWHRFRGPGGSGVSAYTNVPDDWDGQSGRGILWKTKVPGEGYNSPVVWGDRVFLSGGNPNYLNVFCFDALSGSLLWTGDVKRAPPKPDEEPFEVMEDTGFAAPTVATDGKRVFAIFATGDMGCFDFNGRSLWMKNLGRPDNVYGYAASLEVYKNQVLIQYDQADEKAGKSVLLALDGASGKPVWQAKRPVANSWCSPILVQTERGPEIITAADPWVIAYEPARGAEIWRAKCLTGDIAPSPIYAAGLVVVLEPYSKIVAVRADGKGDVTKTHLAWSLDEPGPDICSPLSNGELLFALTSDGLLMCFKIADGEKLWEQDLRTDCRASPSLVGDKLYLLTEKGVMIIAQAGPQYKELARRQLGEKCYASPAFANGRIYIRGQNNLYCIGTAESISPLPHPAEERTLGRKGVRTVLTAERPEFEAKEPIYLRLELDNQSGSPLRYEDSQVAVDHSLTVTGPDGQEVEYTGPVLQTIMAPKMIQAGRTRVLFDRFDVAEQYTFDQPGQYRVQFNGRGLWLIGMTEEGDDTNYPKSFEFYPNKLPSNVLTITVRSSIPDLVAALDDEDEFKRAESATAIGNIDPAKPQALAALIKAMSDESGRVRSAAAQSLVKVGPVNKDVVMAFIKAADDNWKAVRYACDTFFDYLGPEHSYIAPDLIVMLKAPNKRAQRLAITALRNMGEAAVPAVPYLVESMRNSELEAIASSALGKLGPKAGAAVPDLMEMLQDRRERFSAALVLEAIGPAAREAIPALQSCLGQDNRVAHARALLAIDPTSVKAIDELVRIAESPYLPDQWTEQPDAHYLLVKCGHDRDRHLQSLIDALENPNSRIRLSAAAYLGRLGAEAGKALDSLRKALKDDDPEVRVEAAGAILMLAPSGLLRKEAADIVLSSLDGEEVMTRVRAAGALQAFGPQEEWTVAALIVKIHSGELRTSSAVIQALGAIGAPAKEALPYLKQMLGNEDWPIRQAAANAIKGIEEAEKGNPPAPAPPI